MLVLGVVGVVVELRLPLLPTPSLDYLKIQLSPFRQLFLERFADFDG